MTQRLFQGIQGSQTDQSSAGSSQQMPSQGFMTTEEPPRLPATQDDTNRTSPVVEMTWEQNNFVKLLVLPPAPREWTPSTQALDSRALYSMTIPRLIPATEFTRRQGTALRDPRMVFLHEALHGGVFGYQFRQTTTGNFFCIEVFESLVERSIAHGTHYALRRKLRLKSEDMKDKLMTLATSCGITGANESQVIARVCDALGDAVGHTSGLCIITYVWSMQSLSDVR